MKTLGCFLVSIALGLCLLSRNAAAEDHGGDTAAAVKSHLHHILIEVSDLDASLRFYRNCLGLTMTSQSDDFITLESANSGIYLWRNHWGWEKKRAKGERNGSGMYPHFEVPDVASMVARFADAGFTIVQKPKTYNWGTEAFVSDPDGYVIALVSMNKP